MSRTQGELSRGRYDDPRPDLTEDSLLWQQLLAAAKNIDLQLYGNLHGLRCWGLRITRAASGPMRGKLVLWPGAECDASEYPELRNKYMVPYGKEIAFLIGGLT